MIDHTYSSQQTIEGFTTDFSAKLSASNRWVELGKVIPWDRLAQVYYRHLEATKGRKALNARIAIGAMIIKHKLNLSDRETVTLISENPYMQHFLGLEAFQAKPLFDASLFVRIRKRMGGGMFDEFTKILIKEIKETEPKRMSKRKSEKSSQKDKQEESEQEGVASQEKASASTTASTQEPGSKLKGKLKLDATVADIYIKYPTDLDLVAKSREWSEKIIDEMYKRLDMDKKPRTYRRGAHKSYLSLIKKKKKSKKEIRKGIRMQLNCLKRNLGHINRMREEALRVGFNLAPEYERYYEVIQQVYQQHEEMYQTKSNSCKNRIVSLDQPYVRPIVRGKNKATVEFGPKLGLSLVEGYTRIETLSWEAYNEGEKDYKKSVESYYELYGYYPELVQVDRIYATRENRSWSKERGIRMTAKALGRSRKEGKEESNAYQRRKRKQEHNERNHIEGKIGQGKQGYRLNQIRTKSQATASSWIGCIIFVMNLIQFNNDMKKKKGGYFFGFIQLFVYRTERPIYIQQTGNDNLLLPYAA